MFSFQEVEKLTGLDEDQVAAERDKSGTNSLEIKDEKIFAGLLKHWLKEPMFLLLLTAGSLYFFSGKFTEGIIMLLAIIMVAGISFFQEYRSQSAILLLKKLSSSKARVIRNGVTVHLPIEDIVTNDILLLEEGELVAADGKVLFAHDFSLNESILTGESFPVNKYPNGTDEVYRGTMVTGGSAVIRVEAVGLQTMFGKIGLAMQSVKVPLTPLQKQLKTFVAGMVWIGLVAFAVIVGWSYLETGDFTESLFKGLTLAMSILPEEIPVAMSTFYALGAYRLLKSNHIIVKQPQYVETLGAATVICVDKTGTLTTNQMSIAGIYDAASKLVVSLSDANIKESSRHLIEYAMWASEPDPFDSMEKAIHDCYAKFTLSDRRPGFQLIHEYPLSGKPPLMTHIFSSVKNETIIAAKGAPEAILNLSVVSEKEKQDILQQVNAYAAEGYRVLGVGKGSWHENKWPVVQQDFSFEFLGLLAFYDAPLDNIGETVSAFHKAGIRVAMITGDYPQTAVALAKKIGLKHPDQFLTGEQVLAMDDRSLAERIPATSVFARMFPEAKLKVVDWLKDNGEVVAMTGDGVNDGPALKAAHIGISMGKRGSEVAKSAAALILTEDNLSDMIPAVAMGRKIYDNLKKAIRYIVSIHIPIILIVMMPVLLNWKFSGIFTPVHVIFLELIMGPTCSIIFENEPPEKGTMYRAPLKMGTHFLHAGQFMLTVFQGLMIATGCLAVGYYFMQSGDEPEKIRSVVFITLLSGNIFLTLVNRSFIHPIGKTIRYRNKLVGFVVLFSLLVIVLLSVWPFMNSIFQMKPLNTSETMLCLSVGFLTTFWMEGVKYIRTTIKQSS